ncbi:GNAT family N-acetyltransferase [Segeticoccus rhizosphaerae]|uniref:GNAT family N-acetyltransferase n=1 Tax=Segeticoccus rhizosphaerae TaxID=1104777 RepID=UPI0010BF8542|nr:MULTISPECIES: GNAT family N-acetyltransferase [Intrasporangiaceae]
MRRLTSYEEVLEASGGDAFVRYELPSSYPGPAFSLDSAVAFVRTGSSGRTGLTAIGPTDDLDRLLARLQDTGELAQFPVTSVSLPQHAAGLHARYFGTSTGGDWEWMWSTTTPPVFAQEKALVELDDTGDLAEITALLEQGNPTTHAHPGEGVTELWLGVRDDAGALVACAALHRNHAGHPHLSGITVAAHLRGRRLGLAMTAALTRRAVEREGVCTLGMFSDNDVARRLYHGLGYRTAQSWASRRLDP